MSTGSSSQIEIRFGVSSDIHSIADFTRSIALETEDYVLDPDVVFEGVKNGMQDFKNGFYVVAQKNQHIVGCLMVTYEWSDWRNGVQWWLQSVYVDPNQRGTGVFRKLYEFVVDLATKKKNVCGIRLYVDKSNSGAISTYHSVGMTPTNYLMFEKSFLD